MPPIIEAKKEDLHTIDPVSSRPLADPSSKSEISRLIVDELLSEHGSAEDGCTDSEQEDSVAGSTEISSEPDTLTDLKSVISMTVLHYMSEDGPVFRSITTKVKKQNILITRQSDEIKLLKKQLWAKDNQIDKGNVQRQWKDKEIEALKERQGPVIQLGMSRIQEDVLKEKMETLTEKLESKHCMLKKVEECLKAEDSPELIHAMVADFNRKDKETFVFRPNNAKLLKELGKSAPKKLGERRKGLGRCA